VETIYAPFQGCMDYLLDLISLTRLPSMNPFLVLSPPKAELAPYRMILSHKASPSNSSSFQGLITDYFLMRFGGTFAEGEPTRE